MKKRKSKITYLGVIAVTIAMIVTLFTWQGTISQAYASTEFSEQQVVSTASIHDNFADDRVLVVLNRQETMRFKNWTTSDFPEVDLESIVDLSASATEVLDIHYNRQKLTNIL